MKRVEWREQNLNFAKISLQYFFFLSNNEFPDIYPQNNQRQPNICNFDIANLQLKIKSSLYLESEANIQNWEQITA